MNPKLEFLQPQIDCARLGYDEKYQHLLNHMIVRNPEKRATVKEIFHFSKFRVIRIQLGLEEIQYFKERLETRQSMLEH